MLGEWLGVTAVTWVFDAKAAIGSDPTLTAEAKLLKVDDPARNLSSLWPLLAAVGILPCLAARWTGSSRAYCSMVEPQL